MISKNKFVVLGAACATLALGACSTCPPIDADYNDTSYSVERGHEHDAMAHKDGCMVKPEPVVEKVVEPAPVMEKKAEPVFSKSQRK